MRWFCLLGILLVGCVMQPEENKMVVEQPPTEPPHKQQLSEQEKPPAKKETPSGSPMGSAVQTINKSKDEVAETLKLVEQVQAGEVTLDCRENPTRAFKILQGFFGKGYFAYDDHVFWFIAKNGQKVSVNENDGILRDCKYGLFTTFKRLISWQHNGENKIKTEFYVDVSTGELSVHRYRNEVMSDNENHLLRGY